MRLIDCFMEIVRDEKFKDKLESSSHPFKDIYNYCKNIGFEKSYNEFKKEFTELLSITVQKIPDDKLSFVSGGEMNKVFSKFSASILSALTISTVVPSTNAVNSKLPEPPNKLKSIVKIAKNNPGKTASIGIGGLITTIAAACGGGYLLYKAYNKNLNFDTNLKNVKLFTDPEEMKNHFLKQNGKDTSYKGLFIQELVLSKSVFSDINKLKSSLEKLNKFEIKVKMIKNDGTITKPLPFRKVLKLDCYYNNDSEPQYNSLHFSYDESKYKGIKEICSIGDKTAKLAIGRHKINILINPDLENIAIASSVEYGKATIGIMDFKVLQTIVGVNENYKSDFYKHISDLSNNPDLGYNFRSFSFQQQHLPHRFNCKKFLEKFVRLYNKGELGIRIRINEESFATTLFVNENENKKEKEKEKYIVAANVLDLNNSYLEVDEEKWTKICSSENKDIYINKSLKYWMIKDKRFKKYGYLSPEIGSFSAPGSLYSELILLDLDINSKKKIFEQTEDIFCNSNLLLECRAKFIFSSSTDSINYAEEYFNEIKELSPNFANKILETAINKNLFIDPDEKNKNLKNNIINKFIQIHRNAPNFAKEIAKEATEKNLNCAKYFNEIINMSEEQIDKFMKSDKYSNLAKMKSYLSEEKIENTENIENIEKTENIENTKDKNN